MTMINLWTNETRSSHSTALKDTAIPPSIPTTITCSFSLLSDDIIVNVVFEFLGVGRYRYLAMTSRQFCRLYIQFALQHYRRNNITPSEMHYETAASNRNTIALAGYFLRLRRCYYKFFRFWCCRNNRTLQDIPEDTTQHQMDFVTSTSTRHIVESVTCAALCWKETRSQPYLLHSIACRYPTMGKKRKHRPIYAMAKIAMKFQNMEVLEWTTKNGYNRERARKEYHDFLFPPNPPGIGIDF